jgi:hypothetical protein
VKNAHSLARTLGYAGNNRCDFKGAAALPQVIAVPWFEEKTYVEARALMQDRSTLPVHYRDWRRVVETFEEQVRKAGKEVWRATIYPDSFEYWCEMHVLPMDGHARYQWAGEACAKAFSKRVPTALGT